MDSPTFTIVIFHEIATLTYESKTSVANANAKDNSVDVEDIEFLHMLLFAFVAVVSCAVACGVDLCGWCIVCEGVGVNVSYYL